MIDTHCHLLPSIDDGPSTAFEALLLARRLAAEGVSFVLCTPHYSSAFPTSEREALARLEELRVELRAGEVELELGLASEISPSLAVSAPHEELQARSVAGRYVIVEVLEECRPPFFDLVAERLDEVGAVAVFAHPERSGAVRRRPATLDGARAAGSLVQLVAPSLVGRWGSAVADTAWALLETGRADLVGSDAHGIRRRRPRLREAAELVAARFGPAMRERLFEQVPSALVCGLAPAGGAAGTIDVPPAAR